MFEKDYFQKLYPRGATIDGDFNAKEHAKYLKSFFAMMELEVDKLCDFGLGKGKLLFHMMNAFSPSHVEACDVSQFSLDYVRAKSWSESVKLKKTSIHNFKSRHTFDLALCNSVLQYIPSEDLAASLQTMAKSCRYLYCYFPTAEDYEILARELDFRDPYAIERPLSFYQSLMRPYFKIVGYGLLESLLHKEQESPFLDSFYRL